jgi:hypothetical protein
MSRPPSAAAGTRSASKVMAPALSSPCSPLSLEGNVLVPAPKRQSPSPNRLGCCKKLLCAEQLVSFSNGDRPEAQRIPAPPILDFRERSQQREHVSSSGITRQQIGRQISKKWRSPFLGRGPAVSFFPILISVRRTSQRPLLCLGSFLSFSLETPERWTDVKRYLLDLL